MGVANDNIRMDVEGYTLEQDEVDWGREVDRDLTKIAVMLFLSGVSE